ncbi:unnamed protein product [Laminaria digitata]
MTTTKSNLTVGLVGKMTTFELRQEVEKRGLLSELQSINHDTLLRRLVQVIVKEEHERGRENVEEPTADLGGNTLKLRSDTYPSSFVFHRLLTARSERKAAAMERSKRRQADEDYFRTKKSLNVRDEHQEPPTEAVEERDEENATSTVNPRRHKVFVR